MTALTQVLGAVLIVVGVVGYVGTGAASVTALLPALLGAALLVCGLLARREPLHRHAIHAALVFALLGLLGTLPMVFAIGDAVAGTAERPAAVIASTVTALLCLVYVAFGVWSFIAARRAA